MFLAHWEPEPFEKKPGAGAAKKFAGSPALAEVVVVVFVLDVELAVFLLWMLKWLLFF